jgi:hypothetical protein
MMGLFTVLSSSQLYRVAPWLGFGALVAGVGGALAVARGYWASSTRKVRERSASSWTPSARCCLGRPMRANELGGIPVAREPVRPGR